MTLDPELTEFHTSGYTAGLDYNLLLRTVISYKQGSESSFGLPYHSSFVSLGENNSATGLHRCTSMCVLCISVHYIYMSLLIYILIVAHE